MLRSSEKEILSLAAAELEARFDKQLHALVKGAAAQAAACREAGSSWPSMLMRRENVLQQQAERIELTLTPALTLTLTLTLALIRRSASS